MPDDLHGAGPAVAAKRPSPDFTLFGQLKADSKKSFDTLEMIEAVPVGSGTDGEESVPQQEITILSITTGAKKGVPSLHAI